MKVLLKVDVDNLGYAGEVHDVADGYGRNFLLPKDMAVKATNKVLRQAESWRKIAETRRAELRAEYELLSSRIRDAKLTFTARAGDSGKLYGSVTTAQVADQLNELLGTEIDRRKVGTEPLRQLGEHQVPVRLGADFQPSLTVVIESEDGGETMVTPETTEIEEEAESTESFEAEVEVETAVETGAETEAS